MNTEIEFSPSYSLLTVHLETDESVAAEPGAMVAKQGVELQTESSGAGIVGGFRRVLGGESFLVNRFTGGPEGGWVMLAPPAPGDIQERQLFPDLDLFIQKGAFLAGCGSVELSSKFQGFRGVLSGEGLFFLRAYVDESPGDGVLPFLRSAAGDCLGAWPGAGGGHWTLGGLHRGCGLLGQEGGGRYPFHDR